MTRRALPAAVGVVDKRIGFGKFGAQLVNVPEPVVRLHFTHDDPDNTAGTIEAPVEDIANALRRSRKYYVETNEARQARLTAKPRTFKVVLCNPYRSDGDCMTVTAHSYSLEDGQVEFVDAEGVVTTLIRKDAWESITVVPGDEIRDGVDVPDVEHQ